MSIDGFKATPVGDIPADMLKATLDIHLSLITKIIYLLFENGYFPDDLRLAAVCPIFKKNDDLDKENHRPVSVLFNVSKFFQRIIYRQMDAFMQDKLSNLLTGFKKNKVHGTALCTCLKIGKICWIKDVCMCYVYGFIKDF